MNATELAEQATLGALMLDPAHADQITGWLRPGDFWHPWHETIYTTIRERLSARDPIDPVSVGHDLVARHGHRRADLPRLAGLLEAVPPRAEPRRYAVMVLESALRREVPGYGVLLQAGALSAQLAGKATNLTRVTTMVEAALNAGATRWAQAHGQPLAHTDFTNARPAGSPSASPRALRLLPRRTPEEDSRSAALDADRFLRAHPTRDKAAVTARERELIIALIRYPDDIAAVASWLRPEAVADRTWRPVYGALVHLSELGQPIDQVTVAWEVHRAERCRGRGPEVRDLGSAMDTTPAIDPAHAARMVAGDQLRQLADRAAQALRTSAANPGLDLTDLFVTGHLMTSALTDLADALPHQGAAAAEPDRPLRSSLERRSPGPDTDRSAGPMAR
jgi:hypothetical protein